MTEPSFHLNIGAQNRKRTVLSGCLKVMSTAATVVSLKCKSDPSGQNLPCVVHVPLSSRLSPHRGGEVLEHLVPQPLALGSPYSMPSTLSFHVLLACYSHHTRPCPYPRTFAQTVSSVRTPPCYLHELLLTSVMLAVRSPLMTI